MGRSRASSRGPVHGHVLLHEEVAEEVCQQPARRALDLRHETVTTRAQAQGVLYTFHLVVEEFNIFIGIKLNNFNKEAILITS